MSCDFDTILLPLEKGSLPQPDKKARILFLNARYSPGLEKYKEQIFSQQHFYPYADALKERGFVCEPGVPRSGAFDLAMLWGTKNAQETQNLIAQAGGLLKRNGVLLCAAGNKEGGGRLKAQIQKAGFSGLETASKNKMRIVLGRTGNSMPESPEDKSVPILDGRYMSRPGLFGWNKIDQGSALLLEYMPDHLAGSGADFGCGYGYLSCETLKKNKNIRELICIDADFRALDVCKANLESLGENHSCDCDCAFAWDDLTQTKAFLGRFDWIVMNPPFHENKETDPAIGRDFIETARKSLKPGGALYMVANAHLPYEEALQERFSHVEKIVEKAGFKVFTAQK